MKKLHASMLAFARSIQTGEGLFFGATQGADIIIDGALNRSALVPAEVQEISVRGTIGNYMSEKAFGKHDIKQANLQTVDRATLPAGCDRLAVKAAVQFLPNAMKAHASDDSEAIANLSDFVSSYAAKGGFSELAARYLWNLVNARWMWRNLLIMTDKKVYVMEGDQVLLTAKPDEIEQETFPGVDDISQACDGDFISLVDRVAAAFSGNGPVVSVEIMTVGSLPEGSEIFPSEEYLSGEAADAIQRRRGSKNGAGKVLSSIEVDHRGRRVRQATFHPQKIGNAIRCVDEWHGHEDFGAVAADPYAAQTTRAIALRSPAGGCLYDFLTKKGFQERMLTGMEQAAPSEPAFGDAHYVVANLVRGGVFGGKE
ncbi:type I-F CRISPR-associated protein Csy3 [Rhodovibrio sodomensis]|uniref:Type I-F CRISPR-associated protein Csy3 n=1 Tax=Rhodovibrio sodomensis TaxID=1088 RepID=A0ABS1DAX1_9PROT|nr:type I-F CRISPR-associated protein Csy3 [Rhodovibrio sodomensis]MBK1667606.1 type I-F CRISPR-associated protein Csy3 [Rhodovibrio sodomensis]